MTAAPSRLMRLARGPPYRQNRALAPGEGREHFDSAAGLKPDIRVAAGTDRVTVDDEGAPAQDVGKALVATRARRVEGFAERRSVVALLRATGCLAGSSPVADRAVGTGRKITHGVAVQAFAQRAVITCCILPKTGPGQRRPPR